MTNVSQPVSKGDKGTVGDKGIHGSQGMKQPPPSQSSQSASESDQENDAAAALISLAGVCSSKKRSLQQQLQKEDESAKHRRRVSSLSTDSHKTDDDNKKSAPSFRRGATPRLLLERLRAQEGTPVKGMRVAVSHEEGIHGGIVDKVIYDGNGSGDEAASSTCKIVVVYDDNNKTETLEYPDFVHDGIAFLGHSTTVNVS